MFLMLIHTVAVHAYNVVDLPENMTLSDAMGIFNGDEITRVTVSNVADGSYTELTREEILDFYYTAQDMTVYRKVNPTPFRGLSINVYTQNDVKSYFFTSGIQIGLYGDSNYICYKLSDEDTEELLYLDSKYKDDKERQTGEELHRATANDFLKLPAAPWAQSFAQEAAQKSLLPYQFTGKYSDNITREEFCVLLGNMIAVKENYKDLDSYMIDRGEPYLKNYFVDCEGVNDAVNILYALGIVNGKDEEHFDPYGIITREEAAALLCKTAEMYKWVGTNTSLTYSDSGSVSPWAVFYVTWANENKIMTGMTATEFVPQGSYTVEQAIATIVRLYNFIMA